MFLALREMRRARTRFLLLIAAIGLLVFLILAQQAIQNGLITAFVGAIERQSAPVLVFSVDSQRTLQGSVIAPALERQIRAVPGIAGAGRIGQSTFTVRLNDRTGDSDSAVIGYDRADLGAPATLSAGRLPRARGEAVGSSPDYALGDRVRAIGAGGTRGPLLTVVGLAEDAQLQVTPTLFVRWADYVSTVRATNPDAGAVLPSALGVRPIRGLSAAALAARINDASADADALTRARAAQKSPGVSQVRQSFQVIFLLYGLVVPLVTGLFFLIITFQKSAALTLLRAIGAHSGLLVRSLMVQVVLVVGGGLAVGVALYAPLSQLRLGDIALRFDVSAVAFWAVLLMFLGGLLDGLTAGNTGAVRAQRADLIVFSSTARDSLVRSRIDPAVRRSVTAVAGVRRVGGLGSVQLGGRVPGRGARDLVPIVLFGYERAPRGLPATPPPRGEVYADDTLRSKGVRKGTVIRLGPERTVVRVVGFVNDVRYSGQATVWGSLSTWRAVLNANRPAARVGAGVTQALVIDTTGNRSSVADTIDGATGEATSSLTVAEVIDALPGVSQQRTVFNEIIGVTVVIAIVVVALFFALITVERTALYGVLKAIGARSRTLFAGVVLQAVVVTLIASAIGAIAATVLDAAIPPGAIPFVATPARLLSSVVYLLVAAIAGCAFSLRRVLRIDPATAIGGAP